MTDKERNALIPLPSGGLEKIGSGPKSILSGMVSDALALARVREKPLAAARFRIGDYEFRDPDYRQILIWAKALGREPEVVLEAFKSSFSSHFYGEVIFFEIEDGSIINLVWDFHLLPISKFEWVDGLSIKKLVFMGLASTQISLHLPSLNFLNCSNCRLTELDLSAVPALTELLCENNRLVELDLSAVSALTELLCDNNQLVELNLSAVPALTQLECQGNQFIELDLSAVPALTGLWCGGNQLVEVDLSTVPALTRFGCQGNQLVELDLSVVPALTWLECSKNRLVELDLSTVPALTGLRCFNNRLVELDLSTVPALTGLWCFNNRLVELDIRRLEKLTEFSCDPSVTLKKLPTQNFKK